MADDDHDQPRSKRWIAFIVLLVFYVLSIGPAAWVYHALPSPWDEKVLPVLITIYSPLISTSSYSPQFASVLDWYADLF